MNKPNKREYRKLLIRYLKGKCSQDEREMLDRWYESFDQDGRNRIEIPDTDNLFELKDKMFKNITKGIDEREAQRDSALFPGRTGRTGIRLSRPKLFAVVIVVGIGIAITIFSQQIFSTGGRVNQVAVNERPAKMFSKVPGPATIYLSDGSVVWLDDRSWLEYPEAFPDGIREVTLTGEAFFDVATDSTNPFVIHSTNFTTRVLGTSFKIKDHDNEESPEVEVLKGKVMVSVNTSAADSTIELILKSNRKAVYSRKDNSLVESAIRDVAVRTLSSNSKLEFNEVALANIIKVLNAVHDVNITIASEGMKNCIITADLRNETLDVSIVILAKALNADFAVRGKDIILSGKGCVDPKTTR